MNRAQLEHIIRASGEIAKVQEVIILGSQAILGQFPALTEPLFELEQAELSLKERGQKILLQSREVDVLIPEDEEKAEWIDGAIGELSDFHNTHGYYAQGVDSTTATLPDGWRERLILVCNANTNHIRGYCVEIHDLIISKLHAGRPKDLDFFLAASQLHLIRKDILSERLTRTPLSDEQRKKIRITIEQGFST